jgi:hypothetical protein
MVRADRESVVARLTDRRSGQLVACVREGRSADRVTDMDRCAITPIGGSERGCDIAFARLEAVDRRSAVQRGCVDRLLVRGVISGRACGDQVVLRFDGRAVNCPADRHFHAAIGL